jgi:hypothetical protein
VAARLFNDALPAARSFTSARSIALAIVGIQEYLRRFSGDVGARRYREELATSLFDRFSRRATDDWYWPEDIVTYVNARLPQALLFSGQWMHRPEMVEAGLKTLDFLIRIQRSPEGMFQPVGYGGWYRRGGAKARFDQHPIEAETTLEACIEAWHITRDKRWLDEARMCYEWFLGRNDLGVALYDYSSGGCRDGLHPDRVNQNEGAEATLAWMLAAISMEEVKAEEDAAAKPEPERTGKLDADAAGGRRKR